MIEDLCSTGRTAFVPRYIGGLFNIIGDDLVVIDQTMIDGNTALRSPRDLWSCVWRRSKGRRGFARYIRSAAYLDSDHRSVLRSVPCGPISSTSPNSSSFSACCKAFPGSIATTVALSVSVSSVRQSQIDSTLRREAQCCPFISSPRASVPAPRIGSCAPSLVKIHLPSDGVCRMWRSARIPLGMPITSIRLLSGSVGRYGSVGRARSGARACRRCGRASRSAASRPQRSG